MKPDREKIIAELKSYFQREPDVILAFLFGSLDKSNYCGESDIDVAVYLSNQEGENRIWLELERVTGRQIDLVILNRVSPSISFEAMRGIPLTIKDRGFYIDFLLEISWEATDLMEFNMDTWGLREEMRGRGEGAIVKG